MKSVDIKEKEMGKVVKFKQKNKKNKKESNLNKYPYNGKEPIFSERIQRYFTCKKCHEENLDYIEQGMWRRVGFTEYGIEVFCERHGLEIYYINLLDPRETLEKLDKMLEREIPTKIRGVVYTDEYDTVPLLPEDNMNKVKSLDEKLSEK